MPPNHDSRSPINSTGDTKGVISEPTQHAEETTTTTTHFISNHHPPPGQQRAHERTFAIVQYVLFSLLGRKVDQIPSAEAKKVSELTKEILEKHDVYNELCSNLGFSPENLQEHFEGVAVNIFEDGTINWGRIVALLGFSVKVAEHFRSQGFGNEYDRFIVELTTNFIVIKTNSWIQFKGGWGNVITHFDTSRKVVPYSPHHATWFRGVLMTATATIGLGALLAVCK
ncbi:apoptosis regulator BAX-like [Dendronephthya gigantea]|uniref:apoptosis regulator BAX-like n=1 Tax=Dendronephthya gigantea TaxID=151771 RepID=UPI00106B7EEA|nr:apoptosis regulator BAX-like [Dendronephthya gigantea]